MNAVQQSRQRTELDKYLLDAIGPGKTYSQLQTLVNRFGRACDSSAFERGAAAGRQVAVARLTALLMED